MKEIKTRNKDKDSYIKFIAVIDILIKNSDEEHTLTVNDIQNKLYECGYDYKVDHRLINKYIQQYNEHYDDTIIQSYKEGRSYQYYYTNPSLDFMEAKAIVDLVYSSDFFTQQTKENYKKRIQDMFSVHYQMYFNKNMKSHVVKNENAQVFYKELEKITRAIHKHKKIQFLYQKPTLITDIEHQKVEYAPIDTYFSNNEYYLLCQKNDDHLDYKTYRLDYISDVDIVDDTSVYFTEQEMQSFQEKLKDTSYMYSEGQKEIVELDFDQSVYPNIIDKFGKEIKPRKVDEKTYRITVKHYINSTFYSWIIGFGGKIQISGNDKQKAKFKSFLTNNFLNS